MAVGREPGKARELRARVRLVSIVGGEAIREMKTAFRTGWSLAAALATGAALAPAMAQEQTPYDKINRAAAESPITPQPIRGGVSALFGSGGNIGVLTGPDGLFMVDDGIAVSQQKLEDALRSIGPGKINDVVDTHWHWDHTDGNGWVHKGGAAIIAARIQRSI